MLIWIDTFLTISISFNFIYIGRWKLAKQFACLYTSCIKALTFIETLHLTQYAYLLWCFVGIFVTENSSGFIAIPSTICSFTRYGGCIHQWWVLREGRGGRAKPWCTSTAVLDLPQFCKVSFSKLIYRE